MRWWALGGLGLSVVVHAGVTTAIFSIPKTVEQKHKFVTVFEAKPKKDKPKDPDKPKDDKPPEPKKSPPIAKPIVQPAAPPPPDNTPPPPVNTTPTPAGHSAMAALPDFGLNFGGGVAVGGIAVPTGGGGAVGGQRAAGSGGGSEKKVRGPAPKQTEVADLCVEEATKPKVLERVQPHYSDDARSAGIEGPVRVELSVDSSGTVISARIVSGLGHGLDEAALTAAKRMKFSPATRCQKPVDAKFTITMRFQLGD